MRMAKKMMVPITKIASARAYVIVYAIAGWIRNTILRLDPLSSPSAQASLIAKLEWIET